MRALHELRAAHVAVGGTGPGRRTATQQLNHAYAVLVMGQFQGFCRDLHSEAADALSRAVQPSELASVFRVSLTTARALDRGNPTAGTIGSDFGRFGVQFWPEVYEHDSRNGGRRAKLDALGHWRNAIAHQDFTASVVTGRSLNRDTVESWFGACHGLAQSFDIVVGDQIRRLIGRQPW